MQSHHDSEHTQIERSEKSAVGVVDLSVEALPNPKTVNLALLIVLEVDVPRLVHDAPLGALRVVARLLIVVLLFEAQRQVEVTLKVEFYLQQFLVFAGQLSFALSLGFLGFFAFCFEEAVRPLNVLFDGVVVVYFDVEDAADDGHGLFEVDFSNVLNFEADNSGQKVLGRRRFFGLLRKIERADYLLTKFLWLF